jgi:hypothetical protein
MRQQGLIFESRVERAFVEWIETDDGRRVEDEVVRRARLLQARGWKHYGVAALVEAIRYDASVALLGDAAGYRINNSHLSLLARRVMLRNADLAGFFELRELRGRVA